MTPLPQSTTQSAIGVSLIATVILLISWPLDANAKRVLELKKIVTVSEEVIRLADLVKSPSQLTVKEQETEVTHAPRMDTDSQLSIYTVAATLQKVPELLNADLRGSRWIKIQRRQNKKHLIRILNEIRTAIRKHEPWSNWKVDVEFSEDDHLRLSDVGAFDDLKIKLAAEREQLGIVPIRVTLTIGEDEHQETVAQKIINPTITREVTAYVAAQSIKRGTVIGNSHIQTTKIWIGNENRHKNFIASASDCTGLAAKQPLSSGDILQHTDFIQPICVKRGQTVWVTCKNGQLTIQIAGTALENGRRGEYIRIENPASNKVFNAEITGSKRALLNFNNSGNDSLTSATSM